MKKCNNISNKKCFNAIYDELLDSLLIEYKKIKHEAYHNKDSRPTFEMWLSQSGMLFNSIKNVFNIYQFNNEQKYAMLKKFIIDGYVSSMTYNEEELFNHKLLMMIDVDLIMYLIKKNHYATVAEILSYRIDGKLLNDLRECIMYDFNKGVYASRIIHHLNIPNYIDFNSEVKSNAVIDTFNIMYEDICDQERWPTKIKALVCEYDRYYNPYPFKYLNQDNISSLIKTLTSYGMLEDNAIGDMRYTIFSIITERVKAGDIILYDYQSENLKRMKTDLGDISDGKNAFYTRYLLNELMTKQMAKREVVFEKTIPINEAEHKKL